MGTVGLGILLITLTFALSLVLLSSETSASLTFTGRDCNGNSICDVMTSCNSGGCTNSYENCQSCGYTTKVCPNGIATAPKTCSKLSGSPQCMTVTPVCTGSQNTTTDPYVMLTFNVFTRKNLIVNVTPATQPGLAGSTLNYVIGLRNNNPKTLVFQINSQIPANWQINIPAQTSLSENSAREIPFRVTSNVSASDAAYPIIIGLFNTELNLYGTVTAEYVVASRGAPSISSNPRSQEGYPGAALMYNVSVTNNDPIGFDASSVSLRANSPGGFNSVFTPNNIRLAPRATGYVRLDVTSPMNATEQTYSITLNATSNSLSSSELIEYKINFCGNTVCEVGEEGSCLKDCPNDPYINCNGRCERELDDGLNFAATVSVPFNQFIICGRNATISGCLQAARSTVNVSNTCGIGRQCICKSSQPSCDARCVDSTGVYYLLANGTTNVRSIANYSFACPFVNLPEIVALRDNFTAAKAQYEMARSALLETTRNMTAQGRSGIQPCIDALSSMTTNLGDVIRYFNDVIAWPGKLNTTAARGRAVTTRTTIEGIYNTYCRGASGLLQVDTIAAGPVEKGTTGSLDVTIRNIGNIGYYGYPQCDLTGAAGERTSVNGSCTAIGGQQFQTFNFDFNATTAGRWASRCRALGTLSSDCVNASLHHELTGQFNVSTRDTYVVDVSGACNQTLNCSVRTSQPGCGGCSISGQECTSVDSVNNTDLFDCPRASYGTFNLTGYVLDNNRCKPVAPVEKSASVRCAGCGDNVIDSGEQCELPYTDNNAKCTQSRNTCENKIYGLRDALGFCDIGCGCTYDQYQFSCTRGQCGALCADGETRTVILNTTLGSCSCTQQCGSGCDWDSCYCEPNTGGGGTGTITGPPSITVSHTPQTPTNGQVTLTATGANLTQIEIYVDGFVVTSCSSPPCTISATYTAGVHSYYARASNSFAVRTDPADGAKSFAIPSTTGTTTVNVTNTTTSGSVSLTISHTPATPTTADTVTITASASVNANRVEIYVDGVLSKRCTDFICSLESTYSAGTHNYFGRAYDSTGSVTNPATGTKSFTVTQAAGAQNGTSGSPGAGTTNIVLDVSSSPINPTTQDSIRITAVANGPNSFREINIYIDDALKKTCTNSPPSQPCAWTSLYSQGEHSYYAFVTDVSGATKRDPVSGSKTFTVAGSSVSPIPGPAPPAPGPGPTPPLKTTAPVCHAKIDAKNCTYNSATRRYDISLTGSWANGTHAHWDISDDPHIQIYLYNYTRIKPVATPGWNTVKIAVHNVNDTLLCSDTSTVYCGPGTSTGKNVDVIFDVKDVLNTGMNTVKIIVVPYVDISYIRVYSYTENTLNVSRPWVEGNTSLAGISGPVAVVENKTYDVYAMSTSLAATKNVSMVYTLQTSRLGKYTLIAYANYSGKSERYTKTITVTSCHDTYRVYARNDNDNTICMQFDTRCDVPVVGWTIVEGCVAQQPPTPSVGLDLTWIIILLIIILLVALAYRYRDRIRDRINKPRRIPREEMPSFE